MKLKNVNKKLLAGTLAMTLVTAGLVGCNSPKTYFSYKNESGVNVYEDELSYSLISNCKVIVFEKDNRHSIYIVNVVDGSKLSSQQYRKEYYNIFGGECIYDIQKDSNLNIIREESLIDYLVIYNKIQGSYTGEEIEEILELIKGDYAKENDKQLVK